MANSVTNERQRIRAIIGSDFAKGIEGFANYLATETTLDVDQAVTALEITQQTIASQPAAKSEHQPTPFEAMLREAADG